MNTEVVMGVDPSMRSTGIYVSDGSFHHYHLICSQTTKKVRSFSHSDFSLHIYEPRAIKGLDAIGKEEAKTYNVSCVIGVFDELLDIYKPCRVMIEAIAMSAMGRIDELAGLNYAMRLSCVRRNISVYAIAPTSNKMVFAGNGQATKEMMVASWSACEGESNIYKDWLGKHVEDMADAYALYHYPIACMTCK